jgi:two-component system, cell cycle sensor histidine kinase and response regulator CckA
MEELEHRAHETGEHGDAVIVPQRLGERVAVEAEQAIAAFAHGEVDAVTLEASATAVLLHGAQDSLRRNEQVFRAIFDGALDAMLLADDEGSYVDANRAACALFQVPREELIGRNASELAASDGQGAAARLAVEGNGQRPGSFLLQRGDGSRRILDCRVRQDVVPGLHLSVLRDITEQVASEDALRRSEAHFRAVIAKTSEVISLTAADGTTRYLTPSAWRLIGWTPEEMGPRTFREQLVPEDRARVAAELERLVRTGARDMSIELRVLHRDGSIRWLESTGTNLLDDPDVAAIVGNYRDITVRKRAEEALKASEERYRRIVESTSDGIWMYDANGITTFMNHRMAEMLGCTVEEAVGQPVFLFVDEARRVEAEAGMKNRKRGLTERLDFAYRRKDGTELWASVHANTMFDAEGRFEAGLAVVTDVSARRRHDEMRARLAAIVESSEDAIISTSKDGAVTSWNLGAEKLYQYSSDEMVGRPIFLLIPTAIVEEEQLILERAAQGKAVLPYETQCRRKDGTTVEVAVTVSPIRDAAGDVIGVSKVARDLTTRRQVEATLRRTEEQFRQAQKMEAVGRLAGGVAHDFNNLLSVILSYADLILQDLTLGDPMRADVEEVRAAGGRASELTKQLLAMSRQQVLQPRVLDINVVLVGMQRMLGRLLGEDVDLTVLPEHAIGRVLADPGQIEQVVMNLAVNARDAMKVGGKLTIETSNVEFDAAYVGAHFGVAAGHYVLLALSDTGSGMDAATQARIFEPFFTTKDVGKGTGLGLATVFGIVKQSGGQIGVYSELGRGTTFKIYLPRTDRQDVAETPSISAGNTVRGWETILLVEDEEKVRHVACEILRRNGYQVLETSNAGEAFLVSKEFPAKIHLLLTDVVMPRMSGRRLAEELAPQRPGMKVLFASGYTDDTIIHHGVLDAGVAFLQKPFTPATLLRKVRAVLDAHGPDE